MWAEYIKQKSKLEKLEEIDQGYENSNSEESFEEENNLVENENWEI